LRWRFDEEHAYHLTQPEIAHDMIETTKELAELLGISERRKRRLNRERGERLTRSLALL
jgi:hypothetical protein